MSYCAEGFQSIEVVPSLFYGPTMLDKQAQRRDPLSTQSCKSFKVKNVVQRSRLSLSNFVRRYGGVGIEAGCCTEKQNSRRRQEDSEHEPSEA